jgi:hypothetical protein
MKKSIMSGLLVSVLFSSGCATILTEETQAVNISTSNGKEATVVIDGQQATIPGIVQIKKENKNKVIVAETDSCTSQTALNKEVETAFFVNILSGGIFGSSTDYGTEKMWKYQDTVTINCQ